MAEMTSNLLVRLQERRASVDRRRLASISRAKEAAHDWINGTCSLEDAHNAIHVVVEDTLTLAEIDRQIGLLT